MPAAPMSWDLVKSLNSDDENIPNYDESSSSEEEFQPKQEKKNEAKKKKLTKAEEFSQDFDFVASVGDYNTDPWTSDIQKYIKRKANYVPDFFDSRQTALHKCFQKLSGFNK